MLELLALAASTPALASADNAMEPTDAARGPAALEVSTALDSCGTLSDEVICKLDVSYNTLPEAASYSAAVTRADGSVVDYGGVAPGGTSLWVPYVGSGNYSVRVTAYGAPEQPDGGKEVVSTEVTPTETETEVREATSEAEVEASAATSEAEAETRGALEAETDTGQAEAAVEATPTAPTCTAAPPPEPIAPEPLPEPPPEDLDPANPDEDADGIPDEQERVEYEAAVAEQQAAEAVAEVPQSVDC
ncbi:MAG TPA: hypothetical protein VFY37_02895 [Solirubrobacterales bacterium]|nr:hypothetical protein [Solirubrobacterales bacterium]